MQGSARQWRFAIAVLVGAVAAALMMPADRVSGAANENAGTPRDPWVVAG
ncbi:hypothetical protein [Fodinicola acaciae]|nr:hypothetical protein [Fodinicola acaciae]